MGDRMAAFLISLFIVAALAQSAFWMLLFVWGLR